MECLWRLFSLDCWWNAFLWLSQNANLSQRLQRSTTFMVGSLPPQYPWRFCYREFERERFSGMTQFLRTYKKPESSGGQNLVYSLMFTFLIITIPRALNQYLHLLSSMASLMHQSMNMKEWCTWDRLMILIMSTYLSSHLDQDFSDKTFHNSLTWALWCLFARWYHASCERTSQHPDWPSLCLDRQ